MNFRIGVDIQHIPDIKEIYERQKERFTSRIFTPDEIAYCDRHQNRFQHYAVRWAAKEAFYKAVREQAAVGFSFRDVEVARLPSGKPYLKLYGQAEKEAARLHLELELSLSHSGDYAFAVVVAVFGIALTKHDWNES